MAKNLTDKLNTLIRSGVQGFLEDITPSRRHDQSPQKPGKNIDRDIAALRHQIDQALDDEDRMAADIKALQQQIDNWDQQADRALVNGDEATAHHAVRQMQTQQQRLTMLEAELAQHRLSTSELISRVNVLEAMVAQVHNQQRASGQDSVEESESTRPRPAPRTAAGPVVPAVVDEQAIEDDLARRRARLSQ